VENFIFYNPGREERIGSYLLGKVFEMTRRELEEKLFAIRPYCEGALFDNSTDCSGPRTMNEVLYTKGQFPRNQSLHYYLDSEINCAAMCQGHHASIGHSKIFRAWFRELQAQRYGCEAVYDYLTKGPNKIKNL
jgi:hypothetical protein